ncbi:uncharacterized protein LOC114481634 isoform X2 [Gouania willdenowi]|uniref:uncharacterized protein LOC114481634 isoform X2 n=1 Tax=Gouania willdenowi TaxID=441366 RepID=UPI0010562530|nr:uncharacterized protein LOC114481634 isoform X2 [Gouania willdenowi]
MDKVLENVVSMVREHPTGILLKKVLNHYNRAYNTPLDLSALGLDSVDGLVACLQRDLVLKGGRVYHRVHLTDNAPPAHPESTAGETKSKTKARRKAKKDVSLVVKKHPDGIPMKNLLGVYYQTYKKTLDLSSLGYNHITPLVKSVKKKLIIHEGVVYHKHHFPRDLTSALTSTVDDNESRASTPESPASLSRTSTPDPPDAKLHGVPSSSHLIHLTGPPVFASAPLSFGAPVSCNQPGTLSQEQLQQRVIELRSVHQPAVLSMEQLQARYFLQFGEQLTREQYNSLPDSCKAKELPSATTATNKQQQQNTGATFLDSAEFPALGTTRVAEERPVPPSKKDVPVFREAYHAQQRKVFGENMRDMELMEQERMQMMGGRHHTLNLEQINQMMEGMIRQIADEGDLVTDKKVVFRVCRLIPQLDPRTITHWKYSALKNLLFIQREVNMFIESTEAVASITTLYELGLSLAGLKDKKRYEELNLGPLCKLPLVHRLFKIDANTKDDDIHQIETVDILKQLRIFRRKSTKVKVDLADFMKYLADHYSCDSPYKLGIRIQGVGLPISVLMKVSRNEHSIMEQAREVIQAEVKEEIYERLRKMKRSLLELTQGAVSLSSVGSFDLRKKYVSITASELVLEVFTNTRGLFNSRMDKHVQNFLLQVSGDPLATALFQLAICGGSLAVPQDLVPKEKAKSKEHSKPQDAQAATLPSEAKVKQFLKESLAAYNSAVTLAHVASLEKKVAKHFNVEDFLRLEKGNFLDFLVKHIQLLQDTLGSTLILGTSSSSSLELSSSGFRPTKQDVFEFIKQCSDTPTLHPDELFKVESALRSHYRVRDSRDLGHGPLQTLAGLVQRQKSLAGGGLSPIFYEAALLASNGKLSAEEGCEIVGRLGEKSRDQALACLLSCPLLDDLSEWSQWELIFKPLHGSLKSFIERHAANTGLTALEVTPGVLLRITTHTGDKHFSSSAAALDPVGTAGHLVSMVAANGIANAPTALLANHLQNSLATAVAAEGSSQAEDDMLCYSRVANFLLTCLTRIPSRICQTLLQQVFLEPFSKVLGQAKSKVVLMTVAQSNPKQLNCLHRLGILLGISDWVKDYEKKLNPDVTYNSPPAPVEQPKLNVDEGSISECSEEECLENFTLDDNNLQQADDEQEVENEEEEDEDLYELLPKTETSDMSCDAEGGPHSDRDDSDAASSQSEDTISPQRAIIEDIRKSEFGIGVELSAEVQKLVQGNQERLGRSLDRLSTELYSKDTHFVLELIQNADDNSYPVEADTTPALAFVVEKDCITILNNETGFQENNIRAICDVGRSTKGKHQYGYIGQKGIGFKSVFKVTDCPEIHSNGFHLRFDRTSGPMGYILPHWAEDDRPLNAPVDAIRLNGWTTKISLPLRSESHQTRNLFHDVHPSLLLFLHRLRSITIYSQSEKRLITMTRKDCHHNVLEVEHTDGVERWLVVKSTLQPKKIKEDIEATEIALAFKLSRETTGSEILHQPEKQPVFAYLPLRSFGLRFIIQADFDIPSSREDVDRDSSWNQWLRSEIPQLFLQAMDVYTDHPEFQGLKALSQFLFFIPLPDEVMDFFKPVAWQIVQLLKGKAFLPTLGSGDQIVYKLPSQVAVCQDPVIRDVIGGDELEKHLSLSYLHPDLSPVPPSSLLTQLGVRHLRGPDVTTVTTAMAKELSRMDVIHSDGGLRQLARLLVCNFRALEHGYGETDSILETLRDLSIYPLADGSVVSLNGDGVFFPVEESKEQRGRTQTGLSALYEDIPVVHPSLLNCLEPLESQQVRELLKRLGVHKLEPEELLEQHIYPTIRNNKWKSKAESVVVSYLVFIKQHSSSRDYSDIAVPVLTSRGLLCPGTERVHFSKEYGNIDLPKKLPGCDWTLLSPCYVQTDEDVPGWRELFCALGVEDGLIIRKERQSLSTAELASSPWAVEGSMWPQTSAEGFVLDDHPCEEFHSLATAQLPDSILLEQRMALLELLTSNWDSGHCYSKFLTAQVIDSNGHPTKSTKSSFYHYLCRLDWVPAHRPQQGGRIERKFLCPSSVYLTSTEVCDLLGTHVSYINLDSSTFTRDLGMRETVTVDNLIDYLKKWCIQPKGDEQEQSPHGEEGEVEGACFTSTVQHIHNIYNYLQANCSQSSLKQLFQHSPAVFVEENRHDNEWCSGRFYHLKEVCWSDSTKMFQRYRMLTQEPHCPVQEPRVLVHFYSPLKDFFTRLLNVDHSPNMNQYVGLLELICSSSSIPTAEVLQDVSTLYATLAQKCILPGHMESFSQSNLNQSYCSTLKGMVSDKRVFPTKDNKWVSLAQRPMISDSKELEKIFKPYKQVCLLNLPPAEKWTAPKGKRPNMASGYAFEEQDRLLFLEICGIRRLSERVQFEAQTESLRPCPSMQAMVRSVVPYIQRFLYHHDDLGHIYSELIESKIAEKIKQLSFRQVGQLYIRYQLDVTDGEDPVIELQDVMCLLKDQKEFYIQKDHLSANLDICRELVKLFCTENSHRKELMHFLSGLIASLSDQGALTRFLSKEDIRELPSDEEQWEVPEPPKPEFHPERVFNRSYSSTSGPEEPARPAQVDEAQTLMCWPPRASIQSTGSSRTAHADSGAVEAVMKMWPPPCAPKDRDPEKEVSSKASNHEGTQPFRTSSSRAADQADPQKEFNHPQPHNHTGRSDAAAPHAARRQHTDCSQAADEHRPTPTPPPAPSPPADTTEEAPAASDTIAAPEAVLVSSTFHGTSAATDTRPPLTMDVPLWSKGPPPHVPLEDMKLTCNRPTTVLLSDDTKELGAIGEWGEQLVNSFLLQWKDSTDPGRPTAVLWCNQSGESGHPYDFRLSFGEVAVVYVEVKSTVKKEKSFIHLSANELDFALKEKERYQIFRVYSAGDAHNARLCRIQNLAQQLHTKTLSLYLFV